MEPGIIQQLEWQVGNRKIGPGIQDKILQKIYLLSGLFLPFQFPGGFDHQVNQQAEIEAD